MEVSFGEKIKLSMSREERDVLLRKSVARLVDAAKSTRPLGAREARLLGLVVTTMTMYPSRYNLIVIEEQLPVIASCLEHQTDTPTLTESEASLAIEGALIIRGELSLREPEVVIPDYLPENFS